MADCTECAVSCVLNFPPQWQAVIITGVNLLSFQPWQWPLPVHLLNLTTEEMVLKVIHILLCIHDGFRLLLNKQHSPCASVLAVWLVNHLKGRTIDCVWDGRSYCDITHWFVNPRTRPTGSILPHIFHHFVAFTQYFVFLVDHQITEPASSGRWRKLWRCQQPRWTDSWSL